MEHALIDGECVTCQAVRRSDPVGQPEHVFVNGTCTSCSDDDLLDEDSAALLHALNEMDGPPGEGVRAAFDPSKHVRNPKGSAGGGRFRSMVDRLKDAITEHQSGGGKGDPFAGFDREQLRRTAKARGIELKRGESRDDIAKKILDHLGPAKNAEPAKTPAKKAAPKAVPGPLGDNALKKLTDEQVDNGIKMHGTDTAKGKQLLEEKRRRAKKAPAVKPKVRADAIHAAPYLRESGGPARNGVDTKDIDSALTYYKGAGYLGINEDLRKGVKGGREQEDIDAIDAGMGPLASDVEVYRGIRDPAKVFGDAWNDHDVTGLEWRDDAFVSTSGDGRSSNAAFSGANGAVMRIVAPKGTKAVGVTDYAEMELLLDRGLKYRVVKDNGVVEGRRRLDVEVIS